IPEGDEAEPPATEQARQALLRRAEQAAARGNNVRAALLRTRAAPPEAAPAGARSELDRLAQRLQAALGLDDRQAEDWRQALRPLLAPAARGVWPAAARLLYDL